MKRSPITAKKTQTKAIKSLSMGSPCFLTWTEHQIFTSSLEPLLGNWIAKESYLGGKSSQFLIDLNSNCHSRREQFTIDRLQSKKSKPFQKLLPTPLLDDILFESPFSLKKKLFLKRQILDENFLSTSDEYERGEAKEEKKFSDYWNSCLMPSLLLCVCCWNKLGRKRSSFHHHMLIPSCL